MHTLKTGYSLLLVASLVRWLRDPAWVALAVIVIALIYNGLEPFRLNEEIGKFGWLPFSATFSGGLFFSTKVIVSKLFFYGALVWFLERLRWGSIFIVIAVATGIVAGIEVAQLFFTSHTPEITDPIIVLFSAAIVYTARRDGSSMVIEDPSLAAHQ